MSLASTEYVPKTMISDNQLSFIEKLRLSREGATSVIIEGLNYRNQVDLRMITFRDADLLIKKLLTLPPIPNASSFLDSRELEDGIYKKNNTFYKVITSPKTGRMYARKLTPVRLPEGSKRKYKAQWEYAPGALNDLTLDDKIKKEDAQKFGKLYEFCVRCGRTLTAEDSIDRMMGPICYGKLGF